MYNKESEITCDIAIQEGKIIMNFYSEGGKFGTEERLDEYKLTPKRLLEILQDRDDYSENEL